MCIVSEYQEEISWNFDNTPLLCCRKIKKQLEKKRRYTTLPPGDMTGDVPCHFN